jgi:hypothetical protein
LHTDSLFVTLADIEDPDRELDTLGWVDAPLLSCKDPDYRFFRITTTEPDLEAGGKMWMRDSEARVGDQQAEADPVPAIWGCIWKADAICTFVSTNYPLFPVTHQILPGGGYAISLNAYQYRVRGKTMPPLEAKVVFLEDLNGDGSADASDYRLWLNRRIRDPDPIHRTHISYRILNDWEEQGGVLTDVEQSEDIIRSIHNITDGVPQFVYLTGWQYTGHDTGYPLMDKVNERIGGRDAVYRLAAVCKERYNTILSYHLNIDDAYEENPGFDPRFCTKNGISHTIDVETGSIFSRLEATLNTIPVEKVVHLDNMRITNTHTQDEFERMGIGLLEELVCGLKPIIAWLAERGITVTTEGQNGAPIDASLLVQGLWHFDPAPPVFQIYHRKVTGGGYGTRGGPVPRCEFAVVKGIHQDFTYEPWPAYPNIVSMRTDWPDMVDRIYRGALLYHFYLEREMTKFERIPGGVRMEFDGGDVVADSSYDHVLVSWGDVTVAEDDDRFIPRGGAVYCYSLEGTDRGWVLPPALRRRDLLAYTLHREGRGPAPRFSIEGDRIDVELEPRVPVKIVPAATNG